MVSKWCPGARRKRLTLMEADLDPMGTDRSLSTLSQSWTESCVGTSPTTTSRSFGKSMLLECECKNLILSSKCNFLLLLVSFFLTKSLSALGKKSQNETISIMRGIASNKRAKATQSDQSGLGIQIGQTWIELLTFIYFLPETPPPPCFFMLFHIVCIYQPGWWPRRSLGELGLSVSSQKLFQNLLFTLHTISRNTPKVA